MSSINHSSYVVLSDSELINLLKDATLAAKNNLHHTAINRFEDALIVMHELDPEHACPYQWAETYLKISYSAREADDQRLSILSNILGRKELKNTKDCNWRDILNINLQILGDLCSSDIEKELLEISQDTYEIIESKWSELSDQQLFETLTVLTDWLYRTEQKTFAYDLQELISHKTRNDQILNDYLAPIENLVIAKITALEGQIEASCMWIKEAIAKLESTEPTSFLSTFSYLQLTNAELARDEIESAIHANRLALTAINPVDHKASRLLGEVIQGLVDIALKYTDNNEFEIPEELVKKAIQLTEQNYELFLAHDYRTSLMSLKIEILFKQDKLDDVADLLPLLYKEIKLLRSNPDKEVAKAKYLSYRGELALRQAYLDIAHDYFRLSLSIFDLHEDHFYDSFKCREKLIIIFIEQQDFSNAKKLALQTEKFVIQNSSTPKRYLAKINLLHSKINEHQEREDDFML